MCDIIGGDSVIWSLDDDAVGLAMRRHPYFSCVHQWLSVSPTIRREEKENDLKIKYDVSFFCIWCTFCKGSRNARLQENDACMHISTQCVCCKSFVHTVCVCDSPPLPVKVYLCECMILVAFVTLFSWGVCVSCLIKVNPCEAAGAPFLCIPHPPSLSLLPLSLHSTLLSLHPCPPSSWHSDSTGEYAPSRSNPPFLAPAGGVSLETVSELTGWVQIDGCPLSDYTTGPLKATTLDLWAHLHPSALTPNGPFHLTRVNIS